MDIPRAPLGKSGKSCIDWETLAKQFSYKSIIAMLNKLYGDSKEELQEGKMSITKLSKYLGVSSTALTKLLVKHRYTITPGIKKSKNTPRGRRKIHYPYYKLGFKTEPAMWKYFIENRITPKEIIDKISKVSGKYFLYKTVNAQLIRSRRRYKRGEL